MTDRAVLYTSVFIALESGRALDVSKLPTESAISVVTLAELRVGVLAARSVAARAVRLATLESVADIELLTVSDAAAMVWAQMRVELADTGRRLNVNDLWIAATAASAGLAVVTQDDDFDAVDGMAGLVVVRV